MERKDQSNTIDGINNNTYDMLFKEDYQGSRLAKNDKEFLMCAIENFTKLDDKEIKYVIKHTDVFKKSKNGFIASRNGLEYSFALLDNFFDDELREELRSDNRRGKCVQTSVSMAYNFDQESKVVIGYLNSDEERIIHVIFVDCSQDVEIAYDYTKNVVMKKDDYIELNNYEVINEISGDDIREDMKIIRSIDHFSSKLYLCFRDEIMRDLKKNEKVFKLSK